MNKVCIFKSYVDVCTVYDNMRLYFFQFNIYCHLNHKTDLWQNKDKNILQVRKKPIKNNTCTMYYGFPVLSSRDCLMKEPIVPTCTGDDGQRIYIIVSPSPILDLSWNISGRYLFLRSRFVLQTKRK